MNKRQSATKQRLFSVTAAAEYLGRTAWGVRALIWKGILPYIQDSRKIYLDLKDLDAYIEREKKILQ